MEWNCCSIAHYCSTNCRWISSMSGELWKVLACWLKPGRLIDWWDKSQLTLDGESGGGGVEDRAVRRNQQESEGERVRLRRSSRQWNRQWQREKERAWGRWMSLTYPLVVPIPGQIAFSAVVVSNLLIAPSCEREREWEREWERWGFGWGETERVSHWVLTYSTRNADYSSR